jgi:hypothetical protein
MSVTEAMQRICKFGENKSVRSKTSKLFIRRPLGTYKILFIYSDR